MKKQALKLIIFLSAVSLVLTAGGCTVTTRTVSPDEELHYDESYDFSDKKIIVNELVQPLLAKSPLAEDTSRPVIVVYDVANRTSEHISTKAITDDIREELMKAGRFRFVNKTQRENIAKEVEYQYGGRVASGTRVEQARQIGADYILSGTLYSIEKKEPRQVRLKKKEMKYYKLNLELTSIKTGLMEWADSVEIIREASKPFIGW
ncbi:MAG: hypothetical protein GY749_39200 [Desulfobacteraceae bacterium]|nr:hypothetical protein [Desulfobacteraceae bacterium]